MQNSYIGVLHRVIVQNWDLNRDLGRTVSCPRCGQQGVVATATFRAKGRLYTYLVVRHGSRRCILQPLVQNQAAAKPLLQNGDLAKPEPQPAKPSVQNKDPAKPASELAQVLAALERVTAALEALEKRYQLTEQEKQAIRKVFIAKKGYTREESELAREALRRLGV